MPRLLKWWPRDRRQAQSGATLVELLVSVVIMGMALALIVGTLSTGVLDAALAKRNTAATAVVQYELDEISGGPYNPSAQPYSDCFATEDAKSPPTPASGSTCPGGSYTLRADVTVSPGPNANSTQVWTITVSSWPSSAPVGSSVQIIKANR